MTIPTTGTFVPTTRASADPGQADAPEPERDPLYDEPDVEPDPEGTEEGLETDIPPGGEPGPDHSVEGL